MTYDPLDPQADCFRPPEMPVEVCCLHCGREYDSYLIEWRVETSADGAPHGFWCCPTPGCGGRGFGFDILPTDPNYRDERGGWFSDDDDGDVDWDEVDQLESQDGPSQGPQSGNGRTDSRQSGSDDEIPF